ncbi:MAG: fructosamine kinase family protein [Treponema sp.]|nr:fructosamine kinase family protein [Treponema sp.]
MFKTPADYKSLAQALVSLFGNDIAIVQTDRLSGGDINKAYGLHLSNGKTVFMKANEKKNAPFFTAEALALSAIESTKTIATPKVLCTGTDAGEDVGYSFLFLDFIQSAPKNKDYWEVFGRELAQMHKASTEKFTGGKKFGFLQDNFIGARKQENINSDSWVEFFRDSRLAPQFKTADSYFDENDRRLISKLLDHLRDYLIEPEKTSLLHGDLWKGNAMCGPDGKAWLIDPAGYVGNAEADLAMTELFGGFTEEFYASYREENPLQPGYEERRDLYNLYHLLNHLNMFGGNYLNPVKSILQEYVK